MATLAPRETLFFGHLRSVTPLSREEEGELVSRWQEHRDTAAAQRLVKAHLRYVVATANKYRRYGMGLDELIAEGSFGLVYALDKFDPSRGTRLVTYAAYWVRARILGYVLRSWSVVGTGGGALRSRTFFRLRRERARIANLVADKDESERALAETMGVGVVELRKMLERLDGRDVSLDAPLFEEEGQTLVDVFASPDRDQESDLGERQSNSQLRRLVSAALSRLDPREHFIVTRRVMADREDELTLAEIGRRLGVSRERARQLEVRAKRKLKDVLSADGLAGALGARDEWNFA